jgi:MoaA/NifB/PqqE/SkfB family radical SAM enzyme
VTRERKPVNAVASFLYHLGIDSRRRWHPLLSVYYLTYACDFRCPYCSDGAGQPYYRLRSPTLPGHRVVELLRIIRRQCDYLVITGGEPLQDPDFGQVMEGVRRLEFQDVILTTNGLAMDVFLPVVAACVQHLVVSLQTLDSARADTWYGQPRGTHERVLENLKLAAAHPGRTYEIVLSSVVTPDNIKDLYGVYEYAKEHGFRMAASPQLVGVKAHPALAGNPAYRKFYDFLIAQKKRGGRIQGTVDYLEHLRDLRKFSCRPFTMLVVSPAGDVFYPCLEIGHLVGNLFDDDNLHRLRQHGYDRFGPQPNCDNQCHSACALGFSRLLGNPSSILHEAALMARTRFVGSARSTGVMR